MTTKQNNSSAWSMQSLHKCISILKMHFNQSFTQIWKLTLDYEFLKNHFTEKSASPVATNNINFSPAQNFCMFKINFAGLLK